MTVHNSGYTVNILLVQLGWIIGRCTYKSSTLEIFTEPSHVDLVILAKTYFLRTSVRSRVTIKMTNHPKVIADARVTSDI